MIVSEKFYNIECDGCGAILDDEQYYNDVGDLSEILYEHDWKTVNGKHYCPDCYTYDDNDELVIDKSRKV